MNKLLLSVFITGAVLSGNSYAALSSELEGRLLLLEQRLRQAEARAGKAEEKIQQLSHDDRAVNTAVANPQKTPTDTQALTLTGFNNLKLYGDVELNMDGASRSGQLTSIKTNDDKHWKPGNHERWDINGRLLIGLEGYTRHDNGFFSGFTVQPLANINGNMNVDDAAFFFGEEKNWQVKVGRFEAYDMFPLNQDTFVEYSGNTANDLYSDGYGYIYMMKEGRGRSNSGGSLNLSKNIGNWYLELNTLLEEGTALFVDKRYHGNDLVSNKNAVYLRPVVAWKKEAFSAAVAMESNVVKNAWRYENAQGETSDPSRRRGYGLTLSWNGQATDPQDGVIASFSTAYLDAQDEQDFSIGANTLWRRFEVGYIYAHNNIEKFNSSNVIQDGDGVFDAAGKYSIHTVHTSYLFPDIMNMKNFNLYLGAYASMLNSADTGSDGDTRYGMRVRFKYLF
ncbi:carbohydrate porin [Erwinia oleae]|uniref:carbohydrate porin n=1 Tax=Erwinia oleae TaxID=796334 RepID=UPI00054DA6FA|nr:carbohydrate porin [Erwinia oleae]